MKRVWVVIAAFVILGVAYSVVVPLGEAPDEVSHFAYIQYVASHGRLPRPEGAVLGESHQPPLYYLTGALATLWVPFSSYEPIANPDFRLDEPQTPNLLLHTRREGFPYQGAALAWHLVRLLSVLMGAVTVWATARISLELVPGREWIAAGAAAFVAFLPGFLAVSSAVNNDNLVVMLSALGVLQTVRLMSSLEKIPLPFSTHPPEGRGAHGPTLPSWRETLVLGVILGMAVLAKLSGLVVWIFAAGVLAWGVYRTREWKRYALSGLITFATALVIAAPWMLYNLVNFGDPLGWSLVLAATPLRQAPMTMADWLWWIGQTYTSFWGRFGGAVAIRMAPAVYWILGMILLAALAGWFVYARDAFKRKIDSGIVRALGLCGLFWAVMIAAQVRWTLTVLGTDQARQLFPGLPLAALVASVGLARLFRAREKLALAAWTAGSAFVAALVLLYLGTVFASPGAEAASIATLGGNAPADFGKAIRVIDYRMAQSEVAPGGSARVQIEWQAQADVTENYWLLLQLTNAAGVVANKDGVPSGGRLTTDWWHKGERFVSAHAITVPADAAPGTYTLRLGLHPMGRWEWLPVGGKEMMELGKIAVIGPNDK